MQIVLRESLRALSRDLAEMPLALITAPGGSGKTSLVRAWQEDLEASGGRLAWMSLGEIHRDPIFFIEDLVEAIRGAIAAPLDGAEPFGMALTRSLPRSGEIRTAQIVRLLGRELKSLASPVVVCLDALEHLEAGDLTLEIVDQILRSDSHTLRLIITTRGLRPEAASRLLAEARAFELNANDLALTEPQVEQILKETGLALEAKQIEQLITRSSGWAIAVRFAARALSAVPEGDRGRFIDELARERDLFRYIASELIEGVSPAIRRTLEIASLLGSVDRETLAIGLSQPDASEQIDQATKLGLLIEESDRIGVHELLANWLRNQLRERKSEAELRAEQARLGAIAEERDLGLTALRIYTEARLEEPLAALLSREGHGWVNRGQYEIASNALESLPTAFREKTPELIALAGIIEGGRDPDTAIENLKRATEIYRKAGNRSAEFEVLHELAIIAINENRMSEIIELFRYTLTLRRVLLEPRLRGMVAMAMADGGFITGRYGFALRMLRVADGYDHEPRERAGIGLARSSILFHRGEWDKLIEDVDARCADESQRRHGPGFFAMQTRRCAALGFRGVDVAGARATLTDASQMFETARHSLNRYQSELVHGQLCARIGEQESAIEHFIVALGLAERTENLENQAAALGNLARAYQKNNDSKRALESADASLALLKRADTWSARFSTAPFASAGAGLAACVFAELDDPKTALRAFDAKRRRLFHRELPQAAFSLGVMHARIAELAGDSPLARRALRRAWRTHTDAGLIDLGPEMDHTLHNWALESAQREEIETGEERAEFSSQAMEREPALRIKTLGGLAVQLGGKEVSTRTWRGATSQRLFCRLLVAQGQPMPRERIESELWPEATRARAGNNLRVALSKLRDVLEPRRLRGARSDFIDVQGERLALSKEALAYWDVTHWERATLALREAAENQDAERAKDALRVLKQLGPSPFLPDLFDDWAIDFRRALDEKGLKVGRFAIESFLRGNASEENLAVAIAEHLVERHRDDELAWELLTRARLKAGDRAGALRAIADAKAALQAQLGIDIGPGLRDLEAEIR
ncbi:MAG: BTAD domain-containing putative transcriptional regulator [Myxococcota bacterium]